MTEENSRLFDIFMEHLQVCPCRGSGIYQDGSVLEDAGFSAELFEQNRFKPARKHDLAVVPRHTFRLDIRGTLEEIMSAFPKNQV